MIHYASKYRSIRIRLAGCIALVLFALGCSSEPDDGLVKHQVTGKVLVNDVAEKGIAVTFKHTDPSVTKNAARPVAVTDAEGNFRLSTNGEKDGAVAGKYIVSFFWPQGGTSTRDFFDGKYVKTNGPEFEVEIGTKDTEIPPFHLKASQAAVEAAHQALNPPAIN